MITVRSKKVVVLGVTAMLSSGACFAAAPVAVTPSSKAYQEAVQTMLAQPTGEYDLKLNLKLPIMTMTLDNVIDFQAKPFQLKSITAFSAMNKAKSNFMTVYAEQEGDHVNIFSSTETKGKKDIQKKVSKLDSAAPIADSFNKEHSVMSGVKNVAAVGSNQYKVTLDANQLFADVDKAEWVKQGLSKEQADMAGAAWESLKKAGDIAFTVTMDPATKKITHAEGSLGPQLREMALTIVDKNPSLSGVKQAGTKKDTAKDSQAKKMLLVKEMIEKSDLDVVVDVKPLPAGIDLSVPKDIRDNAKTVKK
jgi:hypothetical protein